MRTARVSVLILIVSLLAPVASASSRTPKFSIYAAPAGEANALFGPSEPSIGNNWLTGATLYQSGTFTYLVKFDEKHHTSTWTNVTAPSTIFGGQDPILWTDSSTGRSITSQLFEECSQAAVTDTDGTLWIPSRGCGIGIFDDHQTVGGGPY